MANTVGAVGFGLYARRRNKFRKDFTYNKLHFGCAVQILSALGMAAASKATLPYQTGVLFVGAICMNTIPAYYEGLLEIRNLPDSEVDTSLVRRLGLYCLIGGYIILFI